MFGYVKLGIIKVIIVVETLNAFADARSRLRLEIELKPYDAMVCEFQSSQ